LDIPSFYAGNDMTTDHQATEDDLSESEFQLGMIVTAFIVIATLCTVAWAVTR
jgi:hypothetical protein